MTEPRYPDPRYYWIDVTTVGDSEPQFMRGAPKPPTERQRQQCDYCGSSQSLDALCCSQCAAPL